MNKHILLAMKWLDDKYSVSKEELEENKRAAEAVAYVAVYAAEAYAAAEAYVTAEAYAAEAYATAESAADATAQAAEAYAAEVKTYAEAADYWVDKYFKESGEDKNEYLKELIR